MTKEFKFPDVGEGITEGEIVKWHVKEGDIVKEHEIIVDVETDKAVVNLPSPYSGKVLKIYHKEGDTVKVGEVLVTIEDKTETGKDKIKKKETKKEKKKKSFGIVGEIPEVEEEATQVPLAPIKELTKKVTVLATPAVRRLARDLGVDLAKVKGTGIKGRITEEDVRKAANLEKEEKKEKDGIKIQKKYDFYGYIERIPLKGIRKATAKRMVESAFSIPHVTHIDEANITQLWKLREKEKPKAEKKGIHLTFLPFIIKAAISALKEFPYMNASLDTEHEEIILKKYYNIGIAIDTGSGLVVPVIKEAQDKSILEIAKEIQEFVKKAEERTLDIADFKGHSFTITNVGVIGGLYATPIINPPDVSILATGRIYDKVVPSSSNKKSFEVIKALPLSISFDHRVIDGAYAARFANLFKEYLKDPELLLIED